MLKTRIITAVVLGAIVAAALFGLPPLGWALFGAIAIAAGAWEWAGLARCGGAGRSAFAVGIGLLGFAVALASGTAGGLAHSPRLVIVHAAALLLWLTVVPAWLRKRPESPSRPLVLAVGGVMLLAAYLGLVQIRNLAPAVLVMVMAIVWISDSAAYFAGHHFGRHKLAPTVSPGKTWEGVFGAIVATTLYAVVLRALLPDPGGLFPAARAGGTLAWLVFVWAVTVFGIVGDLFESALKRGAGVKDSGTLLPGHGGVLDRIDALLPILPLAALALTS